MTPTNCDFKDTILNTRQTQRFIIENKSCSYADIRIVTIPACSMSCWLMPTCTVNPKTFQFTPQQNYLVGYYFIYYFNDKNQLTFTLCYF